MSYTPGPWKWESVRGARGKNRRVLIGLMPGLVRHKILTQASDCVGTDADHERLIAAAPQMLAALLMLRDDPGLTESTNDVIKCAIRDATGANP